MQHRRYKRRTIEWKLQVQFVIQATWPCRVSLRPQPAALPWLWGSLSVLATAFWCRGRYRSLRGSSRGCYGCCVGTLFRWRHKVNVKNTSVDQKRGNRVYAWMQKALARSQSNCLFPLLEGWTSVQKCVCVCSYPIAKNHVSWQMPLSYLLQCRHPDTSTESRPLLF